MTKTCINHPNRPVFVYDPTCISMLCKKCYDKQDSVYRKAKQTWDQWFEENAHNRIDML
jgi:hypothetical protein